MTAVAATSGSGYTNGNEFTWSWTTDNTNQGAAGEVTGSIANGIEGQKILTMNISANSSTYKAGSDCPGGSAAVNAAYTNTTATITNNTGSTIRIVKVEATTATCNLTENRILSNGDRFAVSIKANPMSDTDGTSRKNSGSVTITFETVQDVDLVYYGADGVSYTYNDVLLDDATDQVTTGVPAGSSIKLPDAPTVTSGTFSGWRVGHIGSLFQPGTEVAITNHSSIYPVITTAGQVEPFTVGSKTYKFWTDAVAAAGTNGTIVLNQNYTLPTTLVGNGVSPDGTPFITGTDGDISFIIPAGITLLIPYDSGYTLCTTAPKTIDATLVTPSAYITLNMAENTKIIVNGGLSLSGTQNAQYKSNGQPHGPLGVITMAANSNITVNRGGALYAWGYVAGSGTVTIKSGATVYEDFQVRDYRGGDVTSTLAGGTNVSTWHIFPMSQYYVQNVQVPMTLEAGAVEFGYFSVTASMMGIKSEAVDFFGPGALFNVTNGYAVKDYNEEKDRLVIDLYGTLEVNPFSINIQVQGFTSAITINSANYDLPLNSNITLNMRNGSTLLLNQSLLMLPGSVINIESNATLNVNSGKRLIVYDKDQWAWEGKGTGDGYCSDLYKDVIPLAYVYKDTTIGSPKYTRGNKDLVDGQIIVNGTLDASAGYLYTTDGGGNICSTGSGKVIMQTTPAANAYQIAQRRNGSDDFNKNTELDTHPITPAKLVNNNTDPGTEDNDYTETASYAGTYFYNSEIGKWYNWTVTVKDKEETVLNTFYVLNGDTVPATEGFDKYYTDSNFANVFPLESTVSSDTFVYVMTEAPLFDIYGTSVQAGDSLAMYFYVQKEALVALAEGAETTKGVYYAIVEHQKHDANNTLEVSDPIVGELYNDTYYRFRFHGVAAKEMADQLKVVIYQENGETDTAVSKPYIESVEQYAVDLLNAITTAENVGETNALLRTTLVDMLNYGAACQTEFTYNTENLANARIGDYQTFATATLDSSNVVAEGNKYYFTEQTVTTDSALVYTFHFQNVDPNTMAAKISYKDHYGKSVERTVAIDEQGRVDVTGLAIADCNQTITCTIVYKESGDTVTTATGSIAAYANKAIELRIADTTCETLMKFAQSAYKYLHAVIKSA